MGGYALIALRTSYVVNDHVELYANLAIAPSYGPGAPLGAWVGIRVRL